MTFPALSSETKRAIVNRRYRWRGMGVCLMGEDKPVSLRRGATFHLARSTVYVDRVIDAGTKVRFLGYSKPRGYGGWAGQHRIFQFAGETRTRYLHPEELTHPLSHIA